MTSRLLLASGSPRRARLLRQAGFIFTTCAPKVDEQRLAGEPPRVMVERLAVVKASNAHAHAAGSNDTNIAYLAADTAVVLGDEALGKPDGLEHAAQMLTQLSGRVHQVCTGIAVLDGTDLRSTVVISEVTFSPLSAEDIRDYCATGEPLDKAGAYAIQGYAGAFVQRLVGSYSGVVGLPLYEVCQLLGQAGIRPERSQTHD